MSAGNNVQALNGWGAEQGSKDPLKVIERGPRARWWRRRGSKKSGFWYEDASGKRITDAAELERIRSLVIPPAWTHVRISPRARSRQQAIGIDSIGRVQYKYHSGFSARQQQKKYEKIERFGQYLPSLRRRTNEHLGLEGFPRERVLAIIIRLINDLYLRVGSEESVRRYRTYGVTTLRNRHLDIRPGGELIFSFVGKHHIKHRRIIVDEELATAMRDLKALGGAKLFEYVGGDGRVYPIKPRDVNDYIKAATSPEFSAKDFRTWGGTLMAAIKLAEEGLAEDEKEAKRKIIRTIKFVAEHLGNTPTVCRSCYIHPAVLERYTMGITLEQYRPKSQRYIRRLQPEYEPEEQALLKLFRAASGNTSSGKKAA
ncbi:MAG TPA: DNA topoisomerase IB [Blastocatellia bacterium]|jgi:DNA topoisomerase-1|nr:DNA topoisomerase IB [Blastocatellia bacterium]